MESRGIERDLVIKVKYGDTLRRFNVYICGEFMDHGMSALRAKIITLFKFSPDADLVLTYTDEDGDAVTLDGDDDLHDAAIRQQLNPLRIYVQLKSATSGSSDKKSQISSTISAPIECASAVDEALKSIPRIQSAISKLSHDLVSKTTSSAPAIAEMVEFFSNIGLLNITEVPHESAGQPSGTTSVAPVTPLDPSGGDKQEISTDPAPVTTSQPNSNSGNPGDVIQRQNGNDNMTQGRGNLPTCVDLNLDPCKNLHASEFPSANDLLSCTWTSSNMMGGNKEGCVSFGRKSDELLLENLSVPPAYHNWKRNPQDPQSSSKSLFAYEVTGVSGDSNRDQNPIIVTPQQGNHPWFGHTADVMHPPTTHRWNKWNRWNANYHDSMLPSFHRGVQCDGCGMQPITGSRFKSNVKEDYDLCSLCFSNFGNPTEYTKIERASLCPRKPLRESYNHHHSRYRFPPHPFHDWGMRQSKVKLESRFIQDVTVVDGTVMPPRTPFTKIWRMRNNGITAWPCGTQLVWIGGDQFGNCISVGLEIPVTGCPAGEEIDIAVDFVAPSWAGRYISYWRMAAPSGQKFGQRVWVIIQVENPLEESFGASGVAAASGSFHADLNLNLPPESNDMNGVGKEIIDMNMDPLDASPELIEPLISFSPSKSVDSAVTDGAHDKLAPSAFIPYPTVDLPAASSSSGSPSPLDYASECVEAAVVEDDPVEQTLLKELVNMGFNQIDLNKEVLRINKYDLEQSVDDLCGFSEWDPLLAVLHEMGFYDKALNKKLLIENGGSIKRAVLDLIAGEKSD